MADTLVAPVPAPVAQSDTPVAETTATAVLGGDSASPSPVTQTMETAPSSGTSRPRIVTPTRAGRPADAGAAPASASPSTPATGKGSPGGTSAGDRLYRRGMYQLRLREEAQREWRAEQEAKELNGCTFHPAVHAKSAERVETTTSVVQRLQEAEKHRKDTIARLAREQEERHRAKMQPVMMSSRRNMLDTAEMPVHERLFAEQQERKQRAMEIAAMHAARREQESNFHSPLLISFQHVKSSRRSSSARPVQPALESPGPTATHDDSGGESSPPPPPPPPPPEVPSNNNATDRDDPLETLFPAVAEQRRVLKGEFGGIGGALYADARIRQQKLAELSKEEDERAKLAASGGQARAVKPYVESLQARRAVLRDQIAAALEAALAEQAGDAADGSDAGSAPTSRYVAARVQKVVGKALRGGAPQAASAALKGSAWLHESAEGAAHQHKPSASLDAAPTAFVGASPATARSVQTRDQDHAAASERLVSPASSRMTEVQLTSPTKKVIPMHEFSAKAKRWQAEFLQRAEERKQKRIAQEEAELADVPFRPRINPRPAYLDKLRARQQAAATTAGRGRRRSFADPTASSTRRVELRDMRDPRTDAAAILSSDRGAVSMSPAPAAGGKSRARRRSADARIEQTEADAAREDRETRLPATASHAHLLLQPLSRSSRSLVNSSGAGLASQSAHSLGTAIKSIAGEDGDGEHRTGDDMVRSQLLHGTMSVAPYLRGLRRHSMRADGGEEHEMMRQAWRATAGAAPTTAAEHAGEADHGSLEPTGAVDLLSPALRHFYRLFDDAGALQMNAVDSLLAGAGADELAAIDHLAARASGKRPMSASENASAAVPAARSDAGSEKHAPSEPKHVPRGYERALQHAERVRAAREAERQRASMVATRGIAYQDPMAPVLTPSTKSQTKRSEVEAPTAGRRSSRQTSAAEQRAALARLSTGLASDGRTHGHALSNQPLVQRVAAAEPGSVEEAALLELLSADELSALRSIALASTAVASGAQERRQSVASRSGADLSRGDTKAARGKGTPASVDVGRPRASPALPITREAAIAASVAEAAASVRSIRQAAEWSAQVAAVGTIASTQIPLDPPPASVSSATPLPDMGQMLQRAVPDSAVGDAAEGTPRAPEDAVGDRLSRLLASLGMGPQGKADDGGASATVRSILAAASGQDAARLGAQPPRTANDALHTTSHTQVSALTPGSIAKDVIQASPATTTTIPAPNDTQERAEQGLPLPLPTTLPITSSARYLTSRTRPSSTLHMNQLQRVLSRTDVASPPLSAGPHAAEGKAPLLRGVSEQSRDDSDDDAEDVVTVEIDARTSMENLLQHGADSLPGSNGARAPELRRAGSSSLFAEGPASTASALTPTAASPAALRRGASHAAPASAAVAMTASPLEAFLAPKRLAPVTPGVANSESAVTTPRRPRSVKADHESRLAEDDASRGGPPAELSMPTSDAAKLSVDPQAPAADVEPRNDSAKAGSMLSPLQRTMSRLASGEARTPSFSGRGAVVAATTPRILARFEIELAPGLSVPINFKEGDSPAHLARAFAEQHGLNAVPGLQDLLAALIEANIAHLRVA